MPCEHRFIGDLIPDWPLQYLFVGTFNPSWTNPNGNNANWFYGRRTNDFWYIMPQVFGHESLMLPQFRNNRDFLKNWCHDNEIGITDLIVSIDDAVENNQDHVKWILGMQDTDLENFHQINPSNIAGIIEANVHTLQGVFLTRYEHTLNPEGILHQLWDNVSAACNQYQINCYPLVTPSRGYRVINRDQKLQNWQQIIAT